MSFRKPLKNLAGKDIYESFEPLYTIQMIRKWKLDKLKAIINKRKI